MNTTQTNQPAAKSGIFHIGGDIPVHRLGFGAMRLTGEAFGASPPIMTSASLCFDARSNWASRSSIPQTLTDRLFPSD
jgi:hypothetical protein